MLHPQSRQVRDGAQHGLEHWLRPCDPAALMLLLTELLSTDALALHTAGCKAGHAFDNINVRILAEILPFMLQPGVLRWLRLAWRASRRVYLSEQVLMRYRTARLLELWEQSVQSLPQTPVSLKGAARSPVWHREASGCQPSVFQCKCGSNCVAWLQHGMLPLLLVSRQTLQTKAGRGTL